MSPYLKYIKYLNFRTIYFNLRYFPFRTAIKLPVMVSSNVYLLSMNGEVNLPAAIRPGMVKLGYGSVGIFDRNKSRTIWEVNGKVNFAGCADIGHGSKISIGVNGELSLGDSFVITAESTIIANKKVSFGRKCTVSWEVLVMDTDWHKIFYKEEQVNPDSAVVIGNEVWIGCRTTILKGVKISDQIVVAAGSTIVKDLVVSNTVYGGSPVRMLKENISWKL